MIAGIKDKRIKAGLSQEKLARIMNVSLSTVRRWDKSINNMPFAEAVILSKVLQCSLNDLIVEADPDCIEVSV